MDTILIAQLLHAFWFDVFHLKVADFYHHTGIQRQTNPLSLLLGRDDFTLRVDHILYVFDRVKSPAIRRLIIFNIVLDLHTFYLMTQA